MKIETNVSFAGESWFVSENAALYFRILDHSNSQSVVSQPSQRLPPPPPPPCFNELHFFLPSISSLSPLPSFAGYWAGGPDLDRRPRSGRRKRSTNCCFDLVTVFKIHQSARGSDGDRGWGTGRRMESWTNVCTAELLCDGNGMKYHIPIAPRLSVSLSLSVSKTLGQRFSTWGATKPSEEILN